MSIIFTDSRPTTPCRSLTLQRVVNKKACHWLHSTTRCKLIKTRCRLHGTSTTAFHTAVHANVTYGDNIIGSFNFISLLRRHSHTWYAAAVATAEVRSVIICKTCSGNQSHCINKIYRCWEFRSRYTLYTVSGKRCHYIFDYNSRISWWIFIIFIPLDTEINTSKSHIFTYLKSWWRHNCETLHVMKVFLIIT